MKLTMLQAIFVGAYQYIETEKRTYYKELIFRGTELKAEDYVEYEDSNGTINCFIPLY